MNHGLGLGTFEALGVAIPFLGIFILLFGGIFFLVGVFFLGLKVKNRYPIDKRRLLPSILIFLGCAMIWYFTRSYIASSSINTDRMVMYAVIFFMGALVSLIVFVVGIFFISIEKMLSPRSKNDHRGKD